MYVILCVACVISLQFVPLLPTMSYAALWFKNTIGRRNAKYQFEKFGHLLRWERCKENIMDAGCGEGSVTKEILYPIIKNHVHKIVAVDKRDGMISFAKEHNQIEQIDYQIMDVMDKMQVSKAANQFGHIFAIHLSHWIPDTRTLLNGFHKMLKPNGQIFVTGFLDLYMRNVFEKQFKDRKWTKYVPFEPIFANYTENPMEYFENLLANLGFKIEGCDYEEKFYDIEHFTDFTSTALSMYEYLKRIPAALQQEFFQDHLRISKEICPYLGEPDKYLLYYKPFTFVATKIR